MFTVIALMTIVALFMLTGPELEAYSFPGEATLAPFSFEAHPYSRILVFGFMIVGAIALLYGLQVAKPSEQALSVAAIASAVGISFAADFITLFLFWELLTFTGAFIVMLNNTPESRQMGYRFLFFHVVGGLIVFFGILQHYVAAGSLDVVTPEAGLIFFIIGFGFKAAFIPLHVWVPWCYPYSSFPSSVVLAGLTTKVGVFAIARILPPMLAISFMGACMALFGIFCALQQKDLRKLLSYHCVSQVGYMVAGVGLATHYGVDGGLLHNINHMFFKALLFMCAGALIYATGTANVKDLHHPGEDKQTIWRALPLVTAGALIGSFAISGVPPFNGYVSKYLLKKAMYGVPPMEQMLMIASIGTTISFCKFFYFGFIKAYGQIKRRPPVTLLAGIVVMSAGCLLLGIRPDLMTNVLPYQSSLAVYSLDGMWAGIQLVLIGIIFFILTARILEKGVKLPAWCSIEYLVMVPVSKLLLRVLCRSGVSLDTSLNNIYREIGNRFVSACRRVASVDSSLDGFYMNTGRKTVQTLGRTKELDGAINIVYERTGERVGQITEHAKIFEGAINRTYEITGQTALRMAERSHLVEEALDDAYEQSSRLALRLIGRTWKVEKSVSVGYDKVGAKARRIVLTGVVRDRSEEGLPYGEKPVNVFNPMEWNIRNINFDQLLMAIMLGLVIFVLFYYGRDMVGM